MQTIQVSKLLKNVLIADANAVATPRVANTSVYALMGGFLLGIAAWIAAFYRRFRLRGDERRRG